MFSGFVAGTTFFFISSTCLAVLLLPMVYRAGRLEPEGRLPVRSDFSPKRESKSPGPPKPGSRVRYEDGEKQLRRQRQYTAGGIGSSRSRSSKSSRRSLVGPSCISTGETRFTSSFSITARECHWLGNLPPLEVHHFGGEVHGGCQSRIGKKSETTCRRVSFTHLRFVSVMFLVSAQSLCVSKLVYTVCILVDETIHIGTVNLIVSP